MPSVYTPDATNAAQPADSDFAYIIAAEMRALKSRVNTIAGASGPTYKNKLLNGSFDYWQLRTLSTSSGYDADDMWNNLHVGSTKTVSRQAFVLGQTAVPGEPAYYSSTQVTSVGPVAGNYVRKEQRIEGVRTLAGKQVTLSYYAKADASANISVELVQNFGTGGSPSTQVDASVAPTLVTKQAVTASWAKYTFTVTLPSISSKTLGTNNDDYLAVVFWFDAGSSFNSRTSSLGQRSGTYDLAMVQLEAGSVASDFEVKAPGMELLAISRFIETYDRATPSNCIVGSDLAIYFWPATYFFKVRKRATPQYLDNINWFDVSTGLVIADGNVSMTNDMIRFTHLSTRFFLAGGSPALAWSMAFTAYL